MISYYAITGWGDEVALLLVKRIDGKVVDETLVQIFPDQESAMYEMNSRNERLLGGRFLESERLGMVFIPNE